jgi:adhesin transport system outer membrane protein
MKKINIYISLFLFFLTLNAPIKAETLNEFIIMALNSHPMIASQQNQIKSALADKEIARQQFFPTPSIRAETNMTSGTNKNTPTYQGDSSTIKFSLEQPLWTGGRLTADLNKTDAQLFQSNAALEEMRQEIALRVIQAWGEWLGADLKKKAMDQSVEEHQKLKDLVGRRVSEGASSESELVLTKSRLDQVIIQQQIFQTINENAKNKIAQLIGKSVTEKDRPIESHPKYDPIEFRDLQNKVESINPTIKKLEASLKIQDYEIDKIKSDLMPEAYLRAEHQHGDLSYKNVPDSDLLFFGISTKFGPGLSNLSKISSAESRQESIKNELEATKRNVFERAQSDFIQLNSYRQRLPILISSLGYTKSTAESWERQFLAGKKSWLEVMNTTRELSQAEIDLADTQSLLIQTEWRLLILSKGVDNTLKSNYSLVQ